MKNIRSFYIGQANASGIICESKEEFEHFDIMVEPNNN